MNRLSCAATALALIVASSVPAFSASCLNPAEVRAMQVRQLHIQLQVASLNCRTDDPSLPGKYAAYVNRFGGALSDNARVLKAHFARTGGNLDRYVTVLANDESQRAHLIEGYCESHTPLFEKLSSIKPQELEHLAVDTVNLPDTPACSVSPVKQASAEAEIKTKASVNTPKKPAKIEPKG